MLPLQWLWPPLYFAPVLTSMRPVHTYNPLTAYYILNIRANKSGRRIFTFVHHCSLIRTVTSSFTLPVPVANVFPYRVETCKFFLWFKLLQETTKTFFFQSIPKIFYFWVNLLFMVANVFVILSKIIPTILIIKNTFEVLCYILFVSVKFEVDFQTY